VQGSDGNFYGTTAGGGTTDINPYSGLPGYGTIFRISPGGSETILYSFAGSPSDGWDPAGGLVQGGDGNFYGTTLYGGTNSCSCGTVFRISPNGSETTFYSFGSIPYDGSNPQAGLVQSSDGNFYGTTVGGGASGYGTVFRISPSGSYTSLHSFAGRPTDGDGPEAALVQGSDGSFYGTTSGGLPSSGSSGGTVFRFSVPLSMTANSWVAGTGKWETGGNWSLGAAPSAVDPADLITNATSKTVTIDAVTAGIPSALTINNLTVSAPLGSTSTLFLTNAGTATPLSILNALIIGANGAMVVNQSAVQVGSNLVVGVAGGTGALSIINCSAVMVNQLALVNGANSVFTFSAGTLSSGGTFVTNNQVFVVGDGTDPATFQLNGGIHSFANNLEISSNAFLTGCGTIEGNVTIDPGGTVLANCGGTLTFSGIVTNNGTMLAVNSTALQADGPVVNNGLIVATNGTAVFLGGLVNNGVVVTNGSSLTEADVQISSIARLGSKIIVQIPSVTCATYQLQVTPSLQPPAWTNLNASQSGTGGILSFTDTGEATNRPGRFYRIDITLP
jgi:uncharacterized repeat protein (TIGR03803 family)